MEFRVDKAAALAVMNEAASWLAETGKRQDWTAGIENYASDSEFYVGVVDGAPAVAAILQVKQSAQDWSLVDKASEPAALYVHWLAVARDFAQQGLPRQMLDFADAVALTKNRDRLRLDTDASESKLVELYERLGFETVAVIEESVRRTALFERMVARP